MFSIVVLAVFGLVLARAAQPAKARAAVRDARCPVCNGLGFQAGALTSIKAPGPTMCTAKCQLCSERIRFDRHGRPLDTTRE